MLKLVVARKRFLPKYLLCFCKEISVILMRRLHQYAHVVDFLDFAFFHEGQNVRNGTEYYLTMAVDAHSILSFWACPQLFCNKPAEMVFCYQNGSDLL